MKNNLNENLHKFFMELNNARFIKENFSVKSPTNLKKKDVSRNVPGKVDSVVL